jgi:hypothetical protein
MIGFYLHWPMRACHLVPEISLSALFSHGLGAGVPRAPRDALGRDHAKGDDWSRNNQEREVIMSEGRGGGRLSRKWKDKGDRMLHDCHDFRNFTSVGGSTAYPVI